MAEAEDRCGNQRQPSAKGDEPTCGERAAPLAEAPQFLLHLGFEERELLLDQLARLARKVGEQRRNRTSGWSRRGRVSPRTAIGRHQAVSIVPEEPAACPVSSPLPLPLDTAAVTVRVVAPPG